MLIQRVTLSNVKDLVPLFDAYRQFYGQAKDLEGAKSFLTKRLEKDESVAFLAKDETSLKYAGFVHLYPIFSSVSMRKMWLLNDLFVDADFRRKGIGKALMNAARDLAASTNAKGLMLETGIENRSAQELYESLGYERNDGYYVYYLTL